MMLRNAFSSCAAREMVAAGVDIEIRFYYAGSG
jgi:hypothetical protein